MKITYSSSVENICKVNHSFDSGILKVAYVGDNRNGSSISKEAFERSMGSIYNCPIVCNYNRERDEIGSHDMEVVMKDDVPTVVNITQPVGVIPESAKYWWQEFEDEGGVHEYLCIEALIWKRQEAYEKIRSNGITDESMEIRVKSGYMENGVYVIEDFEFLAFCLLEAAPPCYEAASLEMFSMDGFRQKYADMMEEFKNSFKKVDTSVEVEIDNNNQKEGGEEHLEQKMELLAQFGLTVEQVEFDIKEMSVEELETKLNEQYSSAGKPEDEPQFSLTAEQLREELMSALHVEKIKTEWGEMARYIYCDYDSEMHEVFCYDTENWKLYGFTYSMNGDNVVIDFESKKRKRFSIVDFDEGDADDSAREIFSVVAEASASSKADELTTQFNAERAELEEKYNAASNQIEQMNQELTELRQYQQQKLKDERAADEGAVFAMFPDLEGVEAFESLRENCSDISIADLEEKCFAIRGRKSATQTFSAGKQKAPRLPVEKERKADEPYGGLFLQYPPLH